MNIIRLILFFVFTLSVNVGVHAEQVEMIGFFDGDLSHLADQMKIAQKARKSMADLSKPTGSASQDAENANMAAMLNSTLNSKSMMEDEWHPRGNVQFVQEESQNLLQLDRKAGNASIQNTANMLPAGTRLNFYMGVKSASKGDKLLVLYEPYQWPPTHPIDDLSHAKVLQAFDLSALPKQSQISVPLNGVTGDTAFTFLLDGVKPDSTVITLGYFKITPGGTITK